MAHAQDTSPPGFRATLDVTQRLEYSDNPDLEADGTSDIFGRTLLDFGLSSQTRRESFSFNISTNIEELGENQSTLDVTTSGLGLGYNRESRNAQFGLTASYRETDAETSDFDEVFDENGNIISQTDGTRESIRFGVGAELGREAPIGARLDASYNELNFSGTSDPDLTDENEVSLRGQLFFRYNKRATARLTARYSDFDSEGNGVDRETVSFGSGLAVAVTPTLEADVSLAYTEIKRSGDETGTDDGLDIAAGLTKTLRNGTIGVNFESDIEANDDGRRTFLSLNRSMALANGGTLRYRLGGTRSGSSSFDPLVGLDYGYDTVDSRIRVGLSQSVSTDSDNNEEINSRLTASYSQEINTLSSYAVSLSFLDRNELGDTAEDVQRMNLSLTYRHALTEDWGLVGGVSHVRTTNENEPDRTSNSVFVGLQRSFEWSP